MASNPPLLISSKGYGCEVRPGIRSVPTRNLSLIIFVVFSLLIAVPIGLSHEDPMGIGMLIGLIAVLPIIWQRPSLAV